jgi:hypothetical protein
MIRNQKKVSDFSAKKEAERLLSAWRLAAGRGTGVGKKVFWFFFSKKNENPAHG